jgi:hypothetical protein
MSDEKKIEDGRTIDPSPDRFASEKRTISSVDDAMPAPVGSPHKGQSGTAGSGDDAELQSVGQSQSDRAAGKSS